MLHLFAAEIIENMCMKETRNHSFICNCKFLLSDEQIHTLLGLEGILSINHLALLHYPDEETSPES